MTPNEAKQQVLNDLRLKRNAKLAQVQKNKTKAMQNETFVALDKKERELVLEISKQLANNLIPTALEKELKSIKNQKAKVLKSLNLTQEDLQPNFDCKICNDTGICENGICVCAKKQILNLLSEQSNLNPLATFENFKTDNTDKPQTAFLEKAKRFLVCWAQNDKKYANISNVIISGRVGVGKTFLAECTLSEFAKQGKFVYKISAFAMNELFTKFHTTFDYTKQEYLNELLFCDVLLIDDLGTEPLKANITIQYLLLLISERENLGKKTIITTNLNQDQIRETYHERVFSRLVDKTKNITIRLEGKDLRFN